MKSILACIFLLFILAYSSCTQTSAYGDPVQEPAGILKNEKSFLKYQSALNLSEDCVALNTSAEKIDKGKFLQEVSSGDYLPVRLTSTDSLLQIV